MQEHERQVNAADAVIQCADRKQRHHAIADVDRGLDEERIEREHRERQVVKQSGERHRHEADDPHDRNLNDVELVAAPILGAARLLGIEREQRFAALVRAANERCARRQ